MALLLFYLFLALGVSFLCSLLESVLLSITPGFVEAYRQKAPKTGQLLRDLKRDIDRPLAAILSLNTIAHTVGAAGVGAQTLVVFGSAYVAVASAIVTLLILVLSEIIPKTFGALHWRELAPVTARTLKVVIFLTYPLVSLSMKLTQWMSRGRRVRMISQEEFRAMADLGVKEGHFRGRESGILLNLFRLRDLHVYDIMTPRTVMFMLPAEMTVGEVVDSHSEIRFSRIPIYRGSLEQVDGFVLKSEVYQEVSLGNRDKPLFTLLRELPAIPDTVSLIQLFESFLRQRVQIRMVVDEYGGLVGLVTMEDLVETLLGIEIMDETDSVADMQALARRQWQKRAGRLGINIDEEPD